MGDYSYTGAQPHAVTGVTNPVGMISTNPQVINYTSFNKVSSISENNNELTISYGAGKQRIKSVLKQGKAITKTKYYAFDGAYEKIIDNTTGITKELCYLPGVKGYAAIFEKNTTTQTGQLHYILRDHQGSIQRITSESGIVEEELNFDSWGNRRNATNWTYNNVPTSFLFDRGYTGHEMLDIFGLINMNGRVYDPKLGRMLSPDLIVQSPDFTQSYNRYSYCMNNPLMFTDPSGYEQIYDGYEGNAGDGRHGTPFNFNVSLPVNYNGGNIWGGGMGNSGFEGMYGSWASSFENYNTSGQRARSTGSMLSNIRNFFTNFLNNVLNPIRGANGVSGEPGPGGDPNDISNFKDKGGFLSFTNFDDVVDWMRTNSVNSVIGKRELIVYECSSSNANTIYYAMPWGAEKIFDPACNNADYYKSLDYLAMLQNLTSDLFFPFQVTGRLHSHNSCTGKILYGVDDLKKDNNISNFFNTSGNFNCYVVGDARHGVGKYNPSNPSYNTLILQSNGLEYYINKYR